MTFVLWRRLDVPGHDSCRLDGFRLEGTAVFSGPAQVRYELQCDERWISRYGRIQGWVGDDSFDLTIEHSGTAWLLNGKPVAGLEHCLDLDFGFTPATNYTQLRRIALDVGEAADVNVAWIDVPDARLTYLPQRYERRTENTYWYESPTADYAAELAIAGNGFTLSYPGLWELEASPP
jgi:uncharacterized protein